MQHIFNVVSYELEYFSLLGVLIENAIVLRLNQVLSVSDSDRLEGPLSEGITYLETWIRAVWVEYNLVFHLLVGK